MPSAKRQNVISWDEFFMRVAIAAQLRSKDPNTQVGACIASTNHRILSVGYNGTPSALNDDDFPWGTSDDPLEDKHNYVVHAEANAVLNYRGSLRDLEGSTVYVTLFPCHDCAKILAQVGIGEVVYLDNKYADTDDGRISRRILDSCGITYRQVLEQSTTQIEIFDTGIAILAGLMIIPAVFSFSGGNPENLQAGPSLMFITLPKVFASMGIGTAAGILFFVLVLLAALTSAVSLMETCVSTFADEFHWSRKKCCVFMAVVMIVLGSASSMGYGALDFIQIFGMAFLDFFDFLTNSVMMPLAALATCFLILRVVGFKKISEEIEQSSSFRRKKLYTVFLKYFAPICLIIILCSSIANVLGIISM